MDQSASTDLPVVTIDKNVIKKSTLMSIDYREGTLAAGWKISFLFMLANDSLVRQVDFDSASGLFSIPTSLVMIPLQEHKELFLYSYKYPMENAIIAVRARRIPICRLKLR